MGDSIISWEIKSEKQENGIWGSLRCTRVDKLVPRSEEDMLKESAILIAIAEAHPDETYGVCLSDEKGFMVQLSKSGLISIKLDHYKLEGNLLTWVKPEQEQL